MTMQHSVVHIPVTKFDGDNISEVVDQVAVEEPFEIQLQYGETNNPILKTISVTMRTPGNDEELAAGFLFTEGIIQKRKQVKSVVPLKFEDNKMLVTLNKGATPILQHAERNFYTTSSCGICGKTGIEAIKVSSAYLNTDDEISMSSNQFFALSDELRKHQAIFESTGGLHASALFDLQGKLLMVREDVGRHNALDKLIGAAFMQNLLPLNNIILLLSGRASFELVQKAAMAGIKVVAAVGAPSSLAVQLAAEAGITLIGFLRNKRFNIYFDKQRIKFAD